MKRLLLASVLALSALSIPMGPSRALVVECANCSSILQQLVDYGVMIQQKAAQVATLENNMRMYANMIQNTSQLPASVWSSVQSDIAQVRSIANAASVLTGNSGSIITRLQQAQGYADQATMFPSNMAQQFSQWQQTLGMSAQSLGGVLATQQQQGMTYSRLQEAQQYQSQNAIGQMQAIQAGNQLTGLVSTQLNGIQTTLTSYTQYYAAQQLAKQDREARQDAVMLDFSAGHPVTTTGYKSY